MAANHWRLAIDTHSTNHPNTEHDCADLRQTHPSLYPRTNMLWISPECTSHSLAKGRKRKSINQLDLWGDNGVDPAEERSRATMREVVEFTEYHRYDVVIVENVVDIRYWEHYDSWLQAMTNLGYEHRALYLNAQFFGVPQSRDRVYVVFWKRGMKAPNLDFRPQALCSKHGLINAIQAWKKPEYQWGRYGKRRQYVYRCPQCGEDVLPAYVPALAAIDWALPSVKIGERQKPLKPKTLERILAGLRKFQQQAVVVDLGHTHAAHNGKVSSAASPLPTQTGRQNLSLVNPFIAEFWGSSSARPVDQPLAAIETVNHHGLVLPPFLAVLKGEQTAIGVDEPLSTIVASASQHWLVMPPMMLSYANQESPARSVDEPMHAIATGYTPRLLIPPFLTSYYSRGGDGKGWPVSNLTDALPVIPSEPRHAIVIPPMIASVNYYDDQMRLVTEALPTQTTANKQALVTPPFVMSLNHSNVRNSPVTVPLPTIMTQAYPSLVTPEDMLPECGFRMLEPHELKAGMSFPDSYVILGNKRDQVKQIGNAVACNVAQWIIAQCMEALAS